MFLHDVLPITYLPPSQNKILSYFSSQKIEPLRLVSVSLGRRKTEGIVLENKPIKSKMEMRKSLFQIKPIDKVLNNNQIISQQQLELFRWVSFYYFNCLPSLIKNSLPPPNVLKKLDIKEAILNREAKKDVLFLYGDNFDFIKKWVNQTIAKNQQVLFLFPNQIKLEYYLQKLSSLQDLISVVEKGSSSKKTLELYQKINNNEIEIIFGKRSSVFLPYHNLGLIIVIDEENTAFETFETKIHYHTKKAALKLAEIFNADIILTSNSLSVKSYLAIKNGIFKAVNSLEAINKSKTIIQNIALKKDSVFHSETLRLFKKTLDNDGRILVFNNRRGHSPALICNNCGFIFRCQSCEAAMIYHKFNEGNLLICHHCGRKTVAPDICPNCQSHLIQFIGFGNQKILEQLKPVVKNKNIVIFDSDHLKNLRQEKELFEKFQTKNIRVVIATELFLKFFDFIKNIDLVIIPSLEQLLVTPDFQIEERLKHLFDLLTRKTDKIIIQTINPQKDWLNTLIDEEFYVKQLEIRKKTFYPPFSQIIKIEIKHLKLVPLLKTTDYIYQLLQKNLSLLFKKEDYVLSPPISPIVPKVKNFYLKEIYWRLRINSEQGILIRRNAILKLLPDGIKIEIEPSYLF